MVNENNTRIALFFNDMEDYKIVLLPKLFGHNINNGGRKESLVFLSLLVFLSVIYLFFTLVFDEQLRMRQAKLQVLLYCYFLFAVLCNIIKHENGCYIRFPNNEEWVV